MKRVFNALTLIGRKIRLKGLGTVVVLSLTSGTASHKRPNVIRFNERRTRRVLGTFIFKKLHPTWWRGAIFLVVYDYTI